MEMLVMRWIWVLWGPMSMHCLQTGCAHRSQKYSQGRACRLQDCIISNLTAETLEQHNDNSAFSIILITRPKHQERIKSINIMDPKVPLYKIRYLDCTKTDHQGEKANLVCLSPGCSQQPLICSLCTSTTHLGHNFKPLKFYLDELYKEFKTNPNKFQEQLEQLERKKNLLLFRLQDCVEKIARQFMSLQSDILENYANLKTVILQKEAKRNNFEQLYFSMIKEDYGDPNFEIKNYLNTQESRMLSEDDNFELLVTKLTQEIVKIKSNLITHQENKFPILEPLFSEEPNQQLQQLFIWPPNITYNETKFSQSNILADAPSMVLLNLKLASLVGKIRFTVLELNAGGKITMGIIPKEQFDKSQKVYKQTLTASWINSLGKSSSVISSHIGAFIKGTVVDIFVRKNSIKMTSKNNVCTIAAGDKNNYFFFALQGDCKVQVVYPHTK